MNKKPSIYIKARFDNYFSFKDKFYNEKKEKREESWTRDFKWYYYVTRNQACLKTAVTDEQHRNLLYLKNKAINNVKNSIVGLKENDDKQTLFLKALYENEDYILYKSLIREFNEKSKFTGLWDKNGPILKENENAKLEEFKKISDNQIVFEQVISLEKDFVENYQINSPELFYEVFKKQSEKVFKNYGFSDVENINWNIAFHVNTDNFHAHLAFWEKEPKYIEISKNKTKKMSFKKKGEISHNKILKTCWGIEKEVVEDLNLKNLIYSLRTNLLEPLKEKYLWDDTREVYEDLQKSIVKNKSVVKQIVNHLGKNKSWYKLNKTNKFLSNNLNKLIFDFITENPYMRENFYLFDKSLKEKHKELINISKPYFYEKYKDLYDKKTLTKEDLEDKKNDEVYDIFNFYNEQMFGKDGFFSRLGNEVIKKIKDFDFGEEESQLISSTKKAKNKKYRKKMIKKSVIGCLMSNLNKQEKIALEKFERLQKKIAEEQKHSLDIVRRQGI